MSELHLLKTWPEHYEGVESGAKPFEARRDDRGYQVGDTLDLQEYDPTAKRYSGKAVQRTVTTILHGGGFGIESGYCVLGLGIMPHQRIVEAELLRDVLTYLLDPVPGRCFCQSKEEREAGHCVVCKVRAVLGQ